MHLLAEWGRRWVLLRRISIDAVFLTKQQHLQWPVQRTANTCDEPNQTTNCPWTPALHMLQMTFSDCCCPNTVLLLGLTMDVC